MVFDHSKLEATHERDGEETAANGAEALQVEVVELVL